MLKPCEPELSSNSAPCSAGTTQIEPCNDKCSIPVLFLTLGGTIGAEAAFAAAFDCARFATLAALVTILLFPLSMGPLQATILGVSKPSLSHVVHMLEQNRQTVSETVPLKGLNASVLESCKQHTHHYSVICSITMWEGTQQASRQLQKPYVQHFPELRGLEVL